jgi:hypothetical protein
VTIAVKYATLSKDEYNRYMNTSDEQQLNEFSDQMFILKAWGNNPNQKVSIINIINISILIYI